MGFCITLKTFLGSQMQQVHIWARIIGILRRYKLQEWDLV